MNAPLFPSSRPNIRVRVLTKLPATLTGSGGIGVEKIGGVWTIHPAWDDLVLIAPGILLDPATKEIWVHDPVTDVYNRMSLLGLAQALWTGSSTTPQTVPNVAADIGPFITQANKDWPIGSFVMAFSASLPSVYMIGQVAIYNGPQLTLHVPAGSVGSPLVSASDWIITRSAPQGGGATGAPGFPAGLNYRRTAAGAGDPGIAGVGFNSDTVGSINLLRVSHSDRSNIDLSLEIATWDDSTNTVPSPGKARVRVYSAVDPSKFVIASISGLETVAAPGPTGFSTFPLVAPAGPGFGAILNGDPLQIEVLRDGNKGVDGTNGTSGAAGPPGADGNGAGARYNWFATAGAGDPGTGNIGGVNSIVPSAITSLRISKTTAAAQNIAAFLATIDDSTTPGNKGTISILGANNLVNFAMYFLTGPVVDSVGFITVPVSYIGSGGAFANGDLLQALFSRTGDAGTNGAGAGDMIGSVNLAQAAGGVTNTVTARTNLGLGTAAVANTGTSGHTIPYNDTQNTMGDGTASTSPTTGGFKVNGGLGATGSGNFGGDLSVAAKKVVKIGTQIVLQLDFAGTGTNNLFVGPSGNASALTGSNNVAVGAGTMTQISGSAGSNVAVGVAANNAMTTGSGNMALGFAALYYNVVGANNCAVGSNACQGAAGVSINNNVGIGPSSLFNVAGDNNVGIGANAGSLNAAGTGNIYIGINAGVYDLPGTTTTPITGNGNVVIGYGCMLMDHAGNSQLNIGNLLLGSGIAQNNVLATSGQIRIASTLPSTSSTTGAQRIDGGLGVAGQINAEVTGVPIVSNSLNNAQNFWLKAAGVTTGFFGSAIGSPLFVQNPSGLNAVAFADDTAGGTITGGIVFHAVGGATPTVAINGAGSATDISVNLVSKGAGKVKVNGVNALSTAGGENLTGGFIFTPFAATALVAGNTYTPNPVNGNYQFITNNSTSGSVTIAAPASDCAIDVLWTNGAAITGAIIFSGFTVNATSAGAPTTAANAKFVISIRRINGISTYSVVPLQ